MAYLSPRIDPHKIEWEDLPEKSLVLDITFSVQGFQGKNPGIELTPAHIMAFTQRAWRLDPERANECNLIFSCCRTPSKDRQIIGVFRFGRADDQREGKTKQDYFVKSPWDNQDDSRFVFLAEPASETDWNKYVGLMLPPRKQGEANPVRYYTQD